MAGLALWQRPVSYGAVGATQAADLLRYPPAGYRPFERRTRIGHGDARYEHAWTTALSWGIQRNSGFRVEVTDAPAAVADQTYAPVSFDAGGTPIASATAGTGDEVVFGPDGMPFLSPGDTAWLGIPLGPLSIKFPVRVVYAIDERKRKGFAYGTLPGHPESGEKSFVVDQTDDGSVWLTIRAFSRPSGWFWWVAYPVLRLAHAVYARRYFRSLSGPID
ncbi:MAG: DUF1990 family protein [Lacisediminihabitans sp.]